MFPRPARDLAFPLAGGGLLFAAFVLGGLAYQGLVDGGAAEWKAGSALPLPPSDMLKKLGPRPATTEASPYR